MRDSFAIMPRRRMLGRCIVAAAIGGVALAAPWCVAVAATRQSPVPEAVPETVPETVPVPTLADPPVDEGSAEIITPQGEPMTSGGSTTLFSLRLPDQASCPGDSASGNWLVQSFLIPAGDDPGAIRYGVAGPEGSQFPLYAFDSRPYAHQNTRVSSSPDAPGVIPQSPAFNLAVFAPGDVPAGSYTIGIACTYFRQTARYWDTEIVIEANADDRPAQLTWRVPDAAPFEPPSDGSTTRNLTIAGIAVALAAAAVLLWQSRTASPSISPSSSPSSSKDRP